MRSQTPLFAAQAQRICDSLNDLDLRRMMEVLAADPVVAEHVPDESCQLDPRDGTMVIYSQARAHRYQRPVPQVAVTPGDVTPCPICEQVQTKVLDIAPLSEGFSYISQNLYPIVHPAQRLAQDLLDEPVYPDPKHRGRAAYGVHLLQWTSSLHDQDWHNMPVADLTITLERVAELGQKLLRSGAGYMPPVDASGEYFGYLSMMKNYGAAAGASLSHGHQQLVFANIMPQSAFHDWSFHRRHQRTFSRYMLAENAPELTIYEDDYVRLLVPYFMARPLSMQLHLRQGGLNYLHQLSEPMLSALAQGMQTAIQLMLALIPHHQRPAAYNFALHNGPNTDLYVEFYPVTQTNGTFERMGLWICQQHPEQSAAELRAHYLSMSQSGSGVTG